MDLGLRGKVALVAAASRGLGRAVADELAAEGASLVICARGEEALRDAERSLAERTSVLALHADVTERADVERLVREGNERFGRIDIAVTNAGGPPAGPFESHDRETWDRAYRLTLMSAIEIARAVLPGMKSRRWGRIITITSISAKQPVDNLILSTTMRAGVTGFARTLANEVAPLGITVNNVLPGYTRTERLEELAAATAQAQRIAESEVRAGWERQIPMDRLGEPQELAALVTFLASERASYITGTSIPVDGGWIRSLT